jgi:hypothetical protein
MQYSSRLFLWGPLVLLFALAIGSSARWYSVANDLSARLDAMNGHAAMPGVTIKFASKTIGGYPFNVDAELHDFTLTVAGPHGPIAWKAEKFAGHALTYGRAQWIFEAAGKQRLTWTTKSGQPKGLDFEIGSLHASAVFAGAKLERFDFDLVGFDSAAIAIARTQLHMRRNPGADQIDLVASAEELQISPRLRGICGDSIGHIKLDGDFSNGSAFVHLLTGDANWQSGFDAWRKAGGRFYLAQSELACQTSSVFAQGQLGLDEVKRPRGLMTAQIAGFAGLRDGAAQNHAQGTFVDALVNQPQEPNPGQEGRVTVRAAFRDGITYLGNTPAGMNDPLY